MSAFSETQWKSISPHLDELLDLSADERNARLRTLGGTQPELAAQLADALGRHARANEARFLEGPLGVIGTAHSTASGLAGQTFGAYTLDAPLGAGGMGSVWLAHRSDGRFEAKVAVKLLSAALLGSGAEERFRREGNILARLTHPNIARLYDAGATATGQPFLAMEYVEGRALNAYCDDKRLSVRERIDLFLSVLRAVQHAHSNLVLHRDLKPSNILVTREGEVKLLDFGVAKLLDEDGGAATELTQIGERALTPSYASPEQITGAPVSTASDVYSLGVVLYELLSGKLPYELKRGSRGELEEAIVSADPPKPSAAALATEAPARRATTLPALKRLLQGDIDNIALKALAKSPSRRYATAQELADDLTRYLDDEPVSAQAASPGYRVRKFVRRHRTAVLAASSAAVVLIATSVFALWEMREANRHRVSAEDAATRAESTVDFLEFVLSDAGQTGRPFTMMELLTRAERSIQAQYGSLANRAAIEQQINLAALFSGIQQHKKSLELAETAHQSAARAGYADLRRRAACTLGQEQHYIGNVDNAYALLERTITELRPLKEEVSTLADCLRYRADLEITRANARAAVAMASEAVDLMRKAFPASPLRQVSPRLQLAIAYRQAAEHKRADDIYRETTDLLRSLGRERTANAIVTYGNWGTLKADVGDFIAATKLSEAAIDIESAVRPDGKPNQAVSVGYGQRLMRLNRLDEAQRQFVHGRDVSRADGDDRMEAFSLLGLATVERLREDPVAAKAALEAAGAFIRARQASNQRMQMSVVFETGMQHLANRSFAEAKTALSEVVDWNSKAKIRAPLQATALAALAQSESGLGNHERAATLAAQATALARDFALGDEPSFWVGHCLLVQAEIEHASGRADAAREFAQSSLVHLSATIGAEHPSTKKAEALARR